MQGTDWTHIMDSKEKNQKWENALGRIEELMDKTVCN